MADPILDLAWPLATTTAPDGTVLLRTVVQDSDEDIRRGIALVCELRPGDLAWDEELGIPDPAGTTDRQDAANLIAAELRAIDTRPTRIDVLVLDGDADERNLHLKVQTS